MRQVNRHEAKTHLSRLLEEVAAEAFVIRKAGCSRVRVIALDEAPSVPAPTCRLGLLRGQCELPTTSIRWLPVRSPICSKAHGRSPVGDLSGDGVVHDDSHWLRR
jgi:antitoxin (DNA-binding transcriptional repressor) of toxin-antitoxin stability system